MRLEKERGDVLTLRGLDGRQGLRECLKDSGLQGDLICLTKGLSCSSDGKESPCNAGDLGSIPGSGSALDKEMATHFQYSHLENSTRNSAQQRSWWATVHGVAKSQR